LQLHVLHVYTVGDKIVQRLFLNVDLSNFNKSLDVTSSSELTDEDAIKYVVAPYEI